MTKHFNTSRLSVKYLFTIPALVVALSAFTATTQVSHRMINRQPAGTQKAPLPNGAPGLVQMADTTRPVPAVQPKAPKPPVKPARSKAKKMPPPPPPATPPPPVLPVDPIKPGSEVLG